MPIRQEAQTASPSETEIRELLDKICNSKDISSSRRSQTLLRFLVEQTLNGNDALLSSPGEIADKLLRPISAKGIDVNKHLVYHDIPIPGESADNYNDRIRRNKETQLRAVKHRLLPQLQKYRTAEGQEDRVEIILEKRTLKVTFRYKDVSNNGTPKDSIDPEDLLLKLHDLNEKARWLEEKNLVRKMQEAGDQIEDILDDALIRHVRYSPILIESINTLGRLAVHLGNLDLAEFHLKSAMDLCLTQRRGDRTLEFADSLETLARLATQRKEWDEVTIYVLRCAEIREHHLGQQHPTAVKARRDYDLFMFLMKDPRLDGAEEVDESVRDDE